MAENTRVEIGFVGGGAASASLDDAATKKLLKAVEKGDEELVELPGGERCCGFGGTFAVRYPEVSVAMADSKLQELMPADVDLLVSADPGCLMQLGGRLSREGSPVRAVHLATVLAEAIA